MAKPIRTEYVVHGRIHIEWRIAGKLHREDGPATEWANGAKYWYQYGYMHNENGHAFEKDHGYREWWLFDYHLSEEDFLKRVYHD